MISRFCTALALIGVGSSMIAGCANDSGQLPFVRNVRQADELKVKPKFREAVGVLVDKTFGPSPRDMVVPKGATEAGLTLGGIHLASYMFTEKDAKKAPIFYDVERDGKKTRVRQEGGYVLYRRHCQHCHGSSGDGNGPTADFLFPRPRDYRKGLFKFTSTASGQKPTRSDLLKTLYEGLHGTSMPAFEALMTRAEIEQVADYVIFLSMRGEFETKLLQEAAAGGEGDDPKEVLSDEVVEGSLSLVLESWKASMSPSASIDPPIDRIAVRPESEHRASVLRGRDLFWKNDCKDCHGVQAMGNGGSFVDQAVFQELVFRNPEELHRLDDAEILSALLARRKAVEEKTTPPELPEEIKGVGADHPWVATKDILKRLEASGEIKKDGDTYLVNVDEEIVAKHRKDREAWLGSLDDWYRPLRPANLNRGIYKGGRRPLDIFWRLNKGINGAKMPAHQLLKPEETWDLVNFVLALPREPQLLQGTPPPGGMTPTPPAKEVARR